MLLAVLGFSMPGSLASDVYLKEIKPVLQERCYSCHGALKQKAGLRLDTAALIRKGGKNGSVVAPGELDKSSLLERLTHPDPDERMPPEAKPLEAEEIAAIRKWIEAGAPLPEKEAAEEDPNAHWAFQRIERPAVPESDRAHPIDAFLEAKWKEMGLKPQGLIERSLLIRRGYLDAIGLPPTEKQLEDARPWPEIVDELLLSKHHGERWGRHWMDVWRYSDWYGLGAQLRYSQKHIWHWRDWIVESLNEDKGYDRMLVEMLAGDEIAPTDEKVLRATGFLARNYYLFNRTSWLDNTIEHTGKAFLGLTFNCAKCHDHKYDPISHDDYYRMRAIFEPHQVRLDPIDGELDLEKSGLPRVFDDHLEAVTYLHRRGDPKDPDKSREIPPGVPELFADFAPEIKEVKLPRSAYAPAVRPHVLKTQLAQAQVAVKKAEEDLAKHKPVAKETKPKESEAPKKGDSFLFRDDFEGPDPKKWELQADDWVYRDGMLHKSKSDRANKVALMKVTPPRDFELSYRFVTTSGAVFKSVGVRFDRSDDGKTQNHFYTSAHAPDPKLQVFYEKNGKATYPGEAKASYPIKVGETYEIKVRVRGLLVNIWVNDKFELAYQLPERFPGKQMAFGVFDCTAAFDWVEVRSLSPDAEMNEAKGVVAPALDVLKANLTRHVAQEAKVKAMQKAEQAHAEGADDAQELAHQVVRRHWEHQIALGEWESVAESNGGKRRAAQKKAAEAKAKLEALTGEEVDYPLPRVTRKALETPEHKFDDYPTVYVDRSSGRRTALASWLVHRDNPLTARVAVNHLWLRHLGEPLVPTMSDFGRQAPRPVHQELLDWLAMELIESGWSMRHVHRLIMTSEAYQRISSRAEADEETVAKDPENQYFWRKPNQRMEAQVVRDSLLFLAGKLDLSMGGPSLEPATGTRRSLYFKHSRDQRDQFLSMFDDADWLRCYRRSESIAPQQALALSNSKLAMDMSREIAARLAETKDEGAFVQQAYRRLMGRAPYSEEAEACSKFMKDLRELPEFEKRGGETAVRIRLIHALLNHNDFVTIR